MAASSKCALPEVQRSGSSSATGSPSAKIESLDGLRALSILLVLLGHLSGTRGFAKLDLGIGDYAHLGVVVFFVISGFLITTLLVHEHAAHGRVSLSLFYARRSLRIFPASYTYLAAIAVLWWAGTIHLRAADMWCGITYTMNYLPERSWQVGHLWSLSVEEQFYLLWPLTFAMLGPRKARIAAGVVIPGAMLARLASRLFLVNTPLRDLEMFPMVADSLATGCLLAVLRDWLESRDWYLRLFRRRYAVAMLAAILILNRFGDRTVVSVLGASIANVLIAIVIHRCVYCGAGAGHRLLNWRPLAFIGVLSYSLYLWQQPFLNRNSDYWVNAFPQNLCFAVCAALASYFLVERTLAGMRQRLRAGAE